jgi:hypothetical protein
LYEGTDALKFAIITVIDFSDMQLVFTSYGTDTVTDRMSLFVHHVTSV